MRTAAERRKRAGEIAEEQHQFDNAAHEFFLAARAFRLDRKIIAAEEMSEWERRALARTILQADSAQSYESQAAKLGEHAFSVAQESSNQPDSAATALYSLTASLYEEAAHRLIALVERARTNIRKSYYLARAADNLEKAARNLSIAANRSQSWEIEEEFRGLQDQASALRAEADRRSALSGSFPDEDQDTCQRLALAWLAKLSRPKCKGCNRLWSGYVENSRRCNALMSQGESVSAAEHVAAAEWQKAASHAVLEHEQLHQHKAIDRFAQQSVAGNAMALGRAS